MRLRFFLSAGVYGGLAASDIVISQWQLQSTALTDGELTSLSQVVYNSSTWYSIRARKTVFAGLVEAGVYDADQLFYSTNMQDTVDYLPYYSPWLYRASFKLELKKGRHFLLQTNGITPKADIYLNGHETVNKSVQTGSYGGRTYDITNLALEENALLIRVWPTDYNKDFAVGFVDWNPYPPDNGTGVWRDVTIKDTGPLTLGSPRIVHDYVPGVEDVRITVKVDVSNLEETSITGLITASIAEKNAAGLMPKRVSSKINLSGKETRTVSLSITILQARIWWPAQWGQQPLYTAQVCAYYQAAVSDQADAFDFGIRKVTSHVNEHNDTMFAVNGHPFQVRGAGYASDIFMRWDDAKFTAQAQYVLDSGMNTIRLEGKEEHPDLFEIADQIGLMVMAGWECCDKWEAWKYNDEVTATLWNDDDYRTADASMRHEAAMLQAHPSVLAFLVGSDYWPDDRATSIYIDALQDLDWQTPVICSAAKRGYPELLGPSGMKMEGPYDWIPPNYWYGDQLGAAFGFGSELGAGVGTPEIGSLRKFLSPADMEDLWTKPKKGMYHMSTNVSQFYHRTIYNEALWARYGRPTGLDDYLLKAQIMDYEATRAQFEAYSARWNAERPATGLVYWMLNNAWPSLHWNLFDYYLHPAGSFFGAKVGNRMEHVVYDYSTAKVWLINHSLNRTGQRTIDIDLVDLEGNLMERNKVQTTTIPNHSMSVTSVPGAATIKDVVFLRLCLWSGEGSLLSRNVYWLPNTPDVLDWGKSTWYYTPVKTYANLTVLQHLKTTALVASVSSTSAGLMSVTLENQSGIPAFFVRLNLVDASGENVVPATWSDNYLTLFPHEKVEVTALWSATCCGNISVEVRGSNTGPARVLSVA